jgi:hypothetical protein|tara:strand:+ start:328 stop:456 length:129 start_codon:yes stop_codon:yes gene_type:complete
MPAGKGTYGSKRGRPPAKKKAKVIKKKVIKKKPCGCKSCNCK